MCYFIIMKEEEFLRKLGLRIRTLRDARKMTLYDLEDATGIDFSDISKLELGYKNSRVYTLYKISNAFGITVSELLDFNGD